ncbi:MAG: signal peptide peptidase SppA [Lentisphaeria bacterium]|nr:signal peptide peptidase SppA [Lentisphaeria bacterium]
MFKFLYLLPLLVLMSVSCININISDMGTADLREYDLYKDSTFPDKKILVIDINGIIRGGDGVFGNSGVTPNGVREILAKANWEGDIDAIILRMNTPGGEVTASDMIYKDIKAFKDRAGIPVYTSIGSLGASGGYYIAAATDRIYAQPTTVVGSIGVIAQFPKFKGLADKVGFEMVTIKSGANKDMANPLGDMSSEQVAIFQGMVDSMYNRFLKVVILGRDDFKTAEELKPIADGRIYTAQQALDNKLIDRIGYIEDIVKDLKKELNTDSVRVVKYSKKYVNNPTLYAKSPEINLVNLEVLDNLNSQSQAGFFYIWAPLDQ